MILIYDDEGVSRQSVDALAAFFQVKHEVRCVSGDFLQQSDWILHTTVLIIPGGRSLPFYNALGDVGNRNIIQFVREGGCYLGICAGAYYATRKTLFALNLPHELQLQGALNFFDGKAIGPVFSDAEFDYGSEKGALIVDIEIQGEKYPVYYNGGCYFSEDNAAIARYAKNQLPAIIAFPFFKGRVVLSGVHPELGFSTIPDDEDPNHQSLRQSLILHEERRVLLLHYLIDYCLRPQLG